MWLSKVTIFGFKSFADKTELRLEPGVTAIVGPNGVGKCVHGETRIPLADGRVETIHDLVEPALASSQAERFEDGSLTCENPFDIAVLSLNPQTFKIERQKVSAFIKRKSPGFLLRVKTRTGEEVLTTHYHPFFTLVEGRLQPLVAEDLKEGVKIALPCKGEIDSKSEIFWDEITSVEEISHEGWVYDLSVAGTHNFVANNIIVHNSNVVDAIRWVLGEQSAKLLRGERMEDVIFKGSHTRKPLSMAEVALTLTDNRRELPVEYEEVNVARRLYRSGESEYLLNKNPCRLRDITDLFLNTGLGVEPYAIIDLATTNALISAKPQDLRILIEEAAGVMKYKTRKKTALHKLEATEQNLLRITDIIREVERQLHSLKRQANKAERYKSLEERITFLKLYLKFREGVALRGDLEKAEAEEASLRDALAGKETAIARLEALLEEKRLRDLEGEKTLDSAQERLYAVRNRITQSEAELFSRRSLLQELSRRLEEEALSLERVHRRVRLLEEELDREAFASKSLEQELVQKESRLEELVRREERLEEGSQRIGQAFEEHRHLMIEQAMALSGVRNHLSSLKERRRLLRLQADQAKARLEEAERKLEATREREEGLAEEVKALVEQLAAFSAERKAFAAKAAENGETLKRFAFQRRALEEEVGRLKSRLDSLRELEAAFRGVGDGVHLLLQGKASGVPQLVGLRGSLSEALEVAPRYERAIEALLGETLRGVVAGSSEDALCALTFLKERGGRATLLFSLAAEEARRRVQRLREALQALGPVKEGVEGLAVDLVRLRSDEGLLYVVLGEGVVVQDARAAFFLASALPAPFTIATLEGEVLSHRGTLTGGAAAPSGFLSRKREMRELGLTLKGKEATLSALRDEEETAKARISASEQALEALEERSQEAELDRRDRERALSQARAERERLQQELSLSAYEWKSLEEELEQLQRELEVAERGLQEAETEERRLQEEGTALEAQKAALEEDRGHLLEELTATKVEVTSLLERREGARRALVRLQEELEEARGEARRREEEQTSLEMRKGELERAIQGLQETLEALAEEEGKAKEATASHQEARHHEKEEIKRLEEELKPLKKEALELRGALSTLSTKRAELSTALSLLEEGLWKEQEVTLEALSSRFAQEVLDPREAEGELETLKAKLQGLGPVNLAALEEYEALGERHAFLTAQASDLDSSIQTLKATVAEIDKTIRRLFQETLTAVNQHFDRLWKRLFSGGSAELRLSQLDDGEEPGVEMAISLPGKRASNPSLLSSGERALAALALLLALFEVKPSPFCLLDEVDAPLDDANVGRFAALLRELSAQHQFIIITHNKRTMEVADTLYGITMEDGTSKLISVKIEGLA